LVVEGRCLFVVSVELVLMERGLLLVEHGLLLMSLSVVAVQLRVLLMSESQFVVLTCMHSASPPEHAVFSYQMGSEVPSKYVQPQEEHTEECWDDTGAG
jgi:hypothetical protein